MRKCLFFCSLFALLTFNAVSETELIYEPSDEEVVSMADDIVLAEIIENVVYAPDERNCYHSIYKIRITKSFRQKDYNNDLTFNIGIPIESIDVEIGDEVFMLLLSNKMASFDSCVLPKDTINIDFQSVSSLVTVHKIDRSKGTATSLSCNGMRSLFQRLEYGYSEKRKAKCETVNQDLNTLLHRAESAFKND